MSKKVLAVIIGLAVGLIILGTLTALSLPRVPVMDSWYQREIIGQGILTDVAIEGDTILISLRLMVGPYDPDNPNYTTYVFWLNNKALAVQNTAPGPDIFIEPDHLDVKRFQVGDWYVLFRKTGPLRYLLLGEPGPPPNYPITAPTYGR